MSKKPSKKSLATVKKKWLVSIAVFFFMISKKIRKRYRKIRYTIGNARPIEVTLKNFRKIGKLFYNRLSITPLFDNEGQLIYFLGIQ
jgi:hypothetical protein